MPEPVKIAFVGVGSMGQCAHLRNYASLPDCRVTALAELRPELARRVAQRYEVPAVYSSAEDLLEAERPDGIVAIQPFDRHGQVVAPLYAAGVPVLTEKPLAASIAVGERLLTALERGGSWHMVAYHKRSDPASEWARREIRRLKATGELGRLTYVRISMPAGDWIAGGFTDLVRSEEPLPALERDPPAADLSPEHFREYVGFVNYYIHQVNLLRFLLDEPYEVKHADTAGRVLVAETPSGATGTIEMTPYRTTIEWEESALIAFERGYLRLDLPAPLASFRPGRVEALYDPGDGSEPRVVRPHLPWTHAMRRQAENFVAAIRGARQPPCCASEALEDLRMARQYLRLWRGA
jgi:predicted dehydrogenase